MITQVNKRKNENYILLNLYNTSEFVFNAQICENQTA